MELQIPIKGGQTIPFDSDWLSSDDCPTEVYAAIISAGLQHYLNAKMAKMSVKDLEGAKLDEAKAAIMKQAEENKAELMKGNIGRKAKAKDGKLPAAVQTEAMRLARAAVKQMLKDAKKKVSLYAASEITKAAKALLEKNPKLIEQARANVEERAAQKVEGIDLSTLTEDPKKVEEANARKKPAKEKAPAAAVVAAKAKPKADTQPATRH